MGSVSAVFVNVRMGDVGMSSLFPSRPSGVLVGKGFDMISVTGSLGVGMNVESGVAFNPVGSVMAVGNSR